MFDRERNEQNLPITQGFGALKWGISIDAAKRIYPDLQEDDSKFYSKYSKGKGKDSQYIRSRENMKVAGNMMDKIVYQFQYDKLVAISCNHETSSSKTDLFQNIVVAARGAYGKPYNIESRTSEDDTTIKNFRGPTKDETIGWKIDDESVSVIKYTGTSYSSVSVLIFSYQGYFIAIGQER